MKQTARLKAIHAQALKDFDEIQNAVQDERMMCLQDRRFCFIPGAQWEGSLGEQFENKPKFEMNKVAMAVTRAMGESRNNPVTVRFVSKDGAKSDLADICNGLFRADEQDSRAIAAYNNAFEEAISGGFGAYRLRTEYENEEDEDDDRQRIRIEAIYDADSCVFFDLGAKDQEKADAKQCFVLTSMTPEAFKEEYGVDPGSWDKTVNNTEFDWYSPDLVYIAEYYKVEQKSETIRVFKNLLGEEEKFSQEEFDASVEDIDEAIEEGESVPMGLEAELFAMGYVELRSKTVKRKKVHKYILSGQEVLEDCGYIAGKNIPIVPVYGQRRFIDGVERMQGLVRSSKDAQRLKNMQTSKLAEQSAMSSNGVPIFTPEQMAGHTEMWRDMNLNRFPYGLINTMTDQNGNPMPAGPIAYTQPPQIAPAQAALLQLTDQDMKEMLGVDANQDKVLSNISGKAVELQQVARDVSLLIYFSNNAEGRRRGGEIWLGMAKDVYVEDDREMKSIGTQDQVTTVKLGGSTIDKGVAVAEVDLTEADFDVAVEVGPASSSKRQAVQKLMMEMSSLPNMDPDTAQVLQLTALQNTEGEGVADVQEFARKKLVQKGIGKPTDEEAQAMAAQAQQPDQQQEALRAMANQADAEATKARADVVKAIAETEKIKAQTMEIIAGIENDADEKTVQIIERLRGLVGGQPTIPTISQPTTQTPAV